MVPINLLSEYIVRQIKAKYPDISVIISKDAAVINGIKLNLRDIYKDIKRQKFTEEEVYKYLDEIILGFLGFSSDDKIDITRLYPRIYPLSFLKDAKPGYYERYVNNTIVVPVYNSGNMCYTLTEDDINKLHIPKDRIIEIAKRNLIMDTDFDITITETDHGKLCTIVDDVVCCSSYILLEETYMSLAGILGTTFYATIPNRNCFIACSTSLLNFTKNKVNELFKKTPYPITKDFFVMTLDGVSGTAAKEI